MATQWGVCGGPQTPQSDAQATLHVLSRVFDDDNQESQRPFTPFNMHWNKGFARLKSASENNVHKLINTPREIIYLCTKSVPFAPPKQCP